MRFQVWTAREGARSRLLSKRKARADELAAAEVDGAKRRAAENAHERALAEVGHPGLRAHAHAHAHAQGAKRVRDSLNSGRLGDAGVMAMV